MNQRIAARNTGPPLELILASGSAARADLLRSIEIRFRQVAPAVAEPPPLPDESLRRYLARLAGFKARTAAVKFPNRVILSADTAICLPGKQKPGARLRIFGKPRTRTRAAKMLGNLAGREHIIGTGICLIAPPQATGVTDRTSGAGSQRIFFDYSSARVRLRRLTAADIRNYLQQEQPWHCAGAYALQKGGLTIISAIRGNPSTIVGLPIQNTLALLARLKLGYWPPLRQTASRRQKGK